MRRRLNLFRGRVQIYLEPRDLWVGAYVAEDHVYVCPLPMLVVRIDRDWSVPDRYDVESEMVAIIRDHEALHHDGRPCPEGSDGRCTALPRKEEHHGGLIPG